MIKHHKLMKNLATINFRIYTVLSASLVAPAGQLLNRTEPYPMRPNLAATSLVEAYARKWLGPIEDVYFFMQFMWS